jgi:hydrogenase nickel incorporation protein HypA/HybF
MHEMALAEGILAVALDVAEGRSVRRVRVRVGALQRVVPDSLQLCFQLAAEETPAAQATLELAEVPALLRCRHCGVEDGLAPALACRHCGAAELEVVSGDEVLVDGVELDSGWRWRPGVDGEGAAPVELPANHPAAHVQQESEPRDS